MQRRACTLAFLCVASKAKNQHFLKKFQKESPEGVLWSEENFFLEMLIFAYLIFGNNSRVHHFFFIFSLLYVGYS